MSVSFVSLAPGVACLTVAQNTTKKVSYPVSKKQNKLQNKRVVLNPQFSSSHALKATLDKSIFRTQAKPTGTTKISCQAEGDPVQLATAKLSSKVDTMELLSMLQGWANGLNQRGDMPLVLSLKVDNLDNGTRLSLIEVKDAKIEVLVYYDLTIEPYSPGVNVFMALRKGKFADSSIWTVPPDEKTIFLQLQSFLKAAIPQCRVD